MPLGAAERDGDREEGDSTPSRSSGTTRQGPGGGPGRFDLGTLADELGVSASRLEETMQTARPAPGGPPQDMARSLADELGLPVARVQAALEATMPQRGAPQDGTTTPS